MVVFALGFIVEVASVLNSNSVTLLRPIRFVALLQNIFGVTHGDGIRFRGLGGSDGICNKVGPVVDEKGQALAVLMDQSRGEASTF